MYQYDEQGHPFDALALDFFTLNYGSPALDLASSLLCLPLSGCLKYDLLNTYCSALSASVPPVVHVPGRAEIDAEMAAFAKTMIGLPFLLRTKNDELDSLVTSDDPVDYFLALGGDMATERLADIVKHLVNIDYTDVGRDFHSDPAENLISK